MLIFVVQPSWIPIPCCLLPTASIQVGFFFFLWIWPRLWALIQVEPIITAMFTLTKLSTFTQRWVYYILTMSIHINLQFWFQLNCRFFLFLSQLLFQAKQIKLFQSKWSGLKKIVILLICSAFNWNETCTWHDWCEWTPAHHLHLGNYNSITFVTLVSQ